MENYICINGKKTELTEEQLRQLGIEVPKRNPFERTASCLGPIYHISECGRVGVSYQSNSAYSNGLYEVANYCTDKAIMEQRALHETLSRLLWRFSEQNGGKGMFSIADKGNGNFCSMIEHFRYLEPTFKTSDIAKRAITEIIKPFMAEHPDFVW